MAVNDISQYYKLEDGSAITNDSKFASLSANTVIENTESGNYYKKNSNYTNVFDCVSFSEKYIKSTDISIASSGSGNGVASISYDANNKKITQTLTNFAKPSDVTSEINSTVTSANNNLKNLAVGSLSESNGTITYKNINGTALGSITVDTGETYLGGVGINISTSNVISASVGSKSQKGILQVGSGINVSDGVISIDDNYITELINENTITTEKWYFITSSVQYSAVVLSSSSLWSSYSSSGYNNSVITGSGSHPEDGTYTVTSYTLVRHSSYSGNYYLYSVVAMTKTA